MSGDEWYSDEALRKQAELARCSESGERPPISLILGILEPRIPAADDERCARHGLDARKEADGDGRRCQLCIARDEP